jgi:hypothetical protein
MIAAASTPRSFRQGRNLGLTSHRESTSRCPTRVESQVGGPD